MQIRRTLVYGIETGLLAPGTRLPSSRQLTTLLGVSRNTVTAAYQALVDEGFLQSRQRSGIFVADSTTKTGLPRTTQPHHAPAPTQDETPGDWPKRFAIRPSALPQFDKPRDWMDYPYPFLFGQFDPTLFPTNNWREAVRATSSVKEIYGWAGDRVDDDDPDLVEQLRVQVLPRRGIFAQSDEIIITIGSQQALSMLVQLFVGSDTVAGFENPSYPDMRNMVRMATHTAQHLTMDRFGAIPDDIFDACKVAFLTVGHQCPTTAAMPVDRRHAILKAADQNDVIVIEDDYEADLTLDTEAELPCLKSLDGHGRVIYVGSFSKVIAPGLRIGYIVAPPPVIRELRILRRMLLRHPPTNNQRILATFIALGHYRQHLQKAANVLHKRAQLITELLPDMLPSCRWRRDPGAKSFWIEGPSGFDSHALVEAARRVGVLVEAGDLFFFNPDDGRHCFRLGFTSIPQARIEAGLKHLSDELKKLV